MNNEHKTTAKPEARDSASTAGLALGLVTVAFAAGLYIPPAEAEVTWGTLYWDGGSMYFCVCDMQLEECAPCFGG